MPLPQRMRPLRPQKACTVTIYDAPDSVVNTFLEQVAEPPPTAWQRLGSWKDLSIGAGMC